MRRGVIILGLTLGLAGCGMDEPLSGPYTEPPADAGPADSGARRVYIESFDHRGQLAELEGSAVLDSNQGQLTLPVVDVPGGFGTDSLQLGAEEARAGLIQGQHLSIPAGAELDAPDALELRAAGVVDLAGDLHVGIGGLVIVAGTGIHIRGRIESEGPITLFVTKPEGSIRIEGQLATVEPRTNPIAVPMAGISISGRGGLHASGRIQLAGQGTPNLSVDLSGDVYFDSSFALETIEDARVELNTTGAVEFADDLVLRSEAQWIIGASTLRFGTYGNYQLGRLSGLAEASIEIGAGTEVSAGGDELALVAAELKIGPDGQVLGIGESGTSLRLEATSRMDVGHRALVASVTAACEDRGAVWVRIAGPYHGEGEARFRAADQTLASCPDTDTANLVFVARSVEGTPPDLGGAELRIDPALRVVTPAIAARAFGRWTSKPFAVSPDAEPFLANAVFTHPLGTEVRILLGRAEGPDAQPEAFLAADEHGRWPEHEGASWLVLRVELEGSTFDAPVVQLIALGW